MAQFFELAKVFSKVEEIQSRNEMTEILSAFYKDLDKEEVQIVSYLISGRVAPMFVKAEFNYSEKSLVNLLESLVKSKGMKFNVKKEFSKAGDIGDLVYEFLENSKNKGELTTQEVYDILWNLINTTGEGSVDRKNAIVSSTLNKMSPEEAKYFVRIICGSLRLGVNVKTLLDVFSYCVVGDKGIREELDRAHGVSADIGYIASKSVLLKEKDAIKQLSDVKVNPGVPILSRLVERVGSFSEVFERMGSPVLVQPKFDGLRCQIHKFKKEDQFREFNVVWQGRLQENGNGTSLFGSVSEDVKVRLFTRNLEDVTEMFPEIVDAAKSIGIDSFVLDSEILGWNYEKDTFLSYQETMQRRRKYSVGSKMEDIPVQAMIFDVLFENGKDLTQVDTKERIKILENKYNNTPEGIKLSDTEEIGDEKLLEEAFEKYVKKGLEGIIVKQEKGEYKAGFRNYEWIKMKKSMKKGLVDTIDMVIVGYFKGKGRRTDLGIGAFLGAIYNEEEETFDVVCKVGTGLTDDMLKTLSNNLEKEKIEEMYKDVRVDDTLLPDVWVRPEYVVTVEADEITRNLNKSEDSVSAGLSLRFPRLMDIREDKGVEDITKVRELVEMYEMQRI
jgi:DNA ligase-1